MTKVRRDEVLSRQEYEKIRPEFRAKVLAFKAERRIHIGPHLTFLFENHDTILYQVQEMMRSEGIDRDEAIQHEIDTYNELLGEKGELGCTLLIEIEDETKRADLLTKWVDLPKALFMETQNGVHVSATYDPRQVGKDRLSSVQYLKFKVGDQIPTAVVCTLPEINQKATLTPQQSAALAKDLFS